MRYSNLLFSMMSCAALAGCSPNVETRGAVKDPDWKSHISEGVTSRDEVLALLGSPSTRSSFGPETWYYITTRKESFAFLKPEVTDQEILKLTFNADGTVASLEQLDAEDMREVEISDRVTPTEGHQLTFIEQLLGNVGRFNTPNDSAISPGSNRPGGR